MRLIVLPRHAMARLDLDVPYVVISISDPPPAGEPARIPQRWGLRGVLRLAFLDTDPGRHEYGLYQGTSVNELSMQPSDGQAIWEFVKRWQNEVGAIVIHCEAGVSRSPSVAMALADALEWGRSCIEWTFNPTEPPPNLHVYQVVRANQPKEMKCLA
jgi:predicted protein tyrosine phosphatase